MQSILPGKRKADDEQAAPAAEPPPDPDDAAQSEEAAKKRSVAALREWVDHSKSRLDEWQKQVDGKIRGAIENLQTSINPWAGVQKDVKALTERIAELESKLRELEQHEAK